MRFHSIVQLGGKTATGIPVPAEVVASLGSSKRPPVRVTINAHTYRSTLASRPDSSRSRSVQRTARAQESPPARRWMSTLNWIPSLAR